MTFKEKALAKLWEIRSDYERIDEESIEEQVVFRCIKALREIPDDGRGW